VTAAIEALRHSAAVTRMDHVHVLRLSGPGAQALLDAATTSRLFARENQMLQTLMLDANGLPFADAFVCLEEDAWVVLAEGPTLPALREHLERVRSTRTPDAEVLVTDLLTDNVLWSVDGPFAWEVTAALLGPEVLGAPYLSFLTLKGVQCFRAGKTGEYGYLLLVPKAAADETWQRLLTVGKDLGLVEGTLAALDQCALENWHFSIRALGGEALIPHELQLQWRVDAKKEFEGVEALRKRLVDSKVRLTCFVARHAVTRGEVVTLDGEKVGTVLEVGFSSTRGDWVGWAVLEVALAWPGIDKFRVGEGPMATCSPPVIDNRSLFVDQRKHSYRTRVESEFPPLVSR